MSTSKEAGKKVFDAYMYIPSKAMQVSGAVIVGAKDFVFAFTEVRLLSSGVIIGTSCLV